MEVIACRINADWDAIGSLLAARKLYPGAALALPAPQRLLAEDAAGAARLRGLLVFRTPDQLDRAQINRLTLVGARRAAEIGDLASLAADPNVELHIIDHRRAGPGDYDPDLEIVQNVGACVTILTHLLVERGLILSAEEATWAMLGLQEKTGGLLSPATMPRDFQAAAHLREWGADLGVVAEARLRDLRPEQLLLLYDLSHAAARLRVAGRELVVAEAAAPEGMTGLEHCVELLHQRQRAATTAALIVQGHEIKLLARRRGDGLDLARLAAIFSEPGNSATLDELRSAFAISLRGATVPQVREKLVRALPGLAAPPIKARELAERAAPLAADATAAQAQVHVLQSAAPAAPVVDAEGRVVGVLEGATVARALHLGLADFPVRELLAADPLIVDADADLEALFETAAEARQSILPVLDCGHFLGAIDRSRLLAAAGRAWRIVEPSAQAVAAGRRRESLARPLAKNLPPALHALLARVGALAAERQTPAHLVGGCTRDLALGRPNLDLDVVVEGDAIDLAQALAAELGGKTAAHDEFQTATLTVGELRLDLAMARRETYERPGALPRVEPGSLREDAARRDFAVNALLLDLHPDRLGELTDFVDGLADLHNRRLRVLHGLSFVEDPTRLLRAVRFAKRFDFQLDEASQRLFRAAADRGFLELVDGRRIAKELGLIFAEERPQPPLEALFREGLFAHLALPVEFTAEFAHLLNRVARIVLWRRKFATDIDANEADIWLAGVAYLLRPNLKREFYERLSLPAPAIERLLALPAAARQLVDDVGDEYKPTISRLAGMIRERPLEAALLATAVADDDGPFRAVTDYLQAWVRIKPQITGDDLLALGVAPGPIFREILAKIRDARLDGRVVTKHDELALAKQLSEQGK